ncbi:hypothetical protein BY996DRAFT_6439705 [Phakopsora pachyrhizi]|nr:hypothetical protein BY996DRAFT_6439705 [Phakopsora pachyrhizi]
MDQLYNTRSTNNKDKESKEKRWRRALIRALVHQNSIRAEGDYGSVSLLPDPVDAPARCKDGLKDDVIESLGPRDKSHQEFEKDTGEEEGLSITEFILECLLKLPLYLRKVMVLNIIIAGGSEMLPGFTMILNNHIPLPPLSTIAAAATTTTDSRMTFRWIVMRSSMRLKRAESRPLHEPSLSGGPFHPDRQLLNNNRSEEELIVKSWCNRPIE